MIMDMNVDCVYFVGLYMGYLWNGLDLSKKGVYVEIVVELVDMFKGDLRLGDIVMIKGFLGMGMKVVVDGVIVMDEGELC